MIKRATILHLRIPFSIYLMPVFSFAACQWPLADPLKLISIFIILHLFLYPASNGFNSYYDKDEESIGGLKNPPPVSRQLLWFSLLFDAIAVLAGLYFSMGFALMLFIYGLVSKAYSHPAVRLKKYPVLALFTAAFFQGAFTYIMSIQVLASIPFEKLFTGGILLPAGLSSLMLLGFYPMTQVYQHKEDERRGDHTFSIMLGIKGTFYFSGAMFFLAAVGFALYFAVFFTGWYFLAFLLFLSPLLIFFLRWFLRVKMDESQADFDSTMKLNALASICLVSFFLFFAFLQWQRI